MLKRKTVVGAFKIKYVHYSSRNCYCAAIFDVLSNRYEVLRLNYTVINDQSVQFFALLPARLVLVLHTNSLIDNSATGLSNVSCLPGLLCEISCLFSSKHLTVIYLNLSAALDP